MKNYQKIDKSFQKKQLLASTVITKSISCLCILSLVACSEAPQITSSSPSESIVATTEEVKQEKVEKEWATGNCKTENDPCFQIQISYPQFLDVKGKPLAKINATIEKEITNSLQNYQFEANRDSKSQTLDEIVEEIFLTFNQQLEEKDLIPNSWVIELEGKQKSKADNTLTILISNYSYLGGAHPNSYQTYLNFNQKTGELIQLEDIVLDQEAVLNIAEQQFRTTYDLSPDESLTNAGLFENKLELPENFAITKKGLRFVYNPYEIGPYAAGYYQFTIAWDSLEGLVNRN